VCNRCLGIILELGIRIFPKCFEYLMNIAATTWLMVTVHCIIFTWEGISIIEMIVVIAIQSNLPYTFPPIYL